MARWKKIGAWILAVVFVLLLPIVWYLQTYSMKPARSFEVNNTSALDHILIAANYDRALNLKSAIKNLKS